MRTMILMAVLAVAVAACGGVRGPEFGAPGPDDPGAGTPGPDEPVTGEPAPDQPAEPAPNEVETVTPRPGMVDVHPRPFESAEPVDDGRAVRVVFWSGVEPCHVLDRVEVDERPDEVVITLYEGRDPAHPDAVCIEIAVMKAVIVELEEPLGDRRIVDGAEDKGGH